VTAEYPAAPRIAAPPICRTGKALPAGRRLRQLRPVILAAMTAAALLLVWQIVVTALRIPAVILPPPVEIAHELWRVLPVLLLHALPTTLDSLMAFFTASALGIGLAIVITYSPFLRDMLYPNLVLFQLIPKVALAPLFVVWLGISSESRVAFAAFVSFFPVVISLRSASPISRPRHCGCAAR
jgi:NitT/TauT family transport system permease protein